MGAENYEHLARLLDCLGYLRGERVPTTQVTGIDPDGDVQAFEGEAQLSDEGVISGGVGNEYRAVTHAPLPLLFLLAVLTVDLFRSL